MIYHLTLTRACQKLKYNNIKFWQEPGTSEYMLSGEYKIGTSTRSSTGQYLIKSWSLLMSLWPSDLMTKNVL